MAPFQTFKFVFFVLCVLGASWIYSATVGPSRVLPDVVESDKFLNMTLLDRLAKFVVEREVKEVEVNFVSKEELMKRHK